MVRPHRALTNGKVLLMTRNSATDDARAKRFANIGSDDGFYNRSQSMAHPAYLEGYNTGQAQYDGLSDENKSRVTGRQERDEKGRFA